MPSERIIASLFVIAIVGLIASSAMSIIQAHNSTGSMSIVFIVLLVAVVLVLAGRRRR
jgi:flagellar biosynthesis protein FliQ